MRDIQSNFYSRNMAESCTYLSENLRIRLMEKKDFQDTRKLIIAGLQFFRADVLLDTVYPSAGVELCLTK